MLRYGRTVHAHDHDAGCAERTASRPHVVLRRFALAIAAALALPATASAADIHATPSTFASAVSSAQAGDRILLATGSYGTWSGTNKAITVKNEDGATPTMKFAFGSGDSGFTLDGMSGMSGDIDSGANHITIKNSAFNDTTTIQGVTNGAILFDHDTFNNINATNGGPPARIWLPGSTPHPSGVTVQNSQLIGGSTDGIQAGTALTILNNEFANIVHGSCGSCHTDNIQLFGGQADDGVGSTIKGNYLHDGETGIVQFDGGGGHDIEDNVIARMSIFGMDFGGDDNSKIIHNTQFQSTGNGLDMTSKAGQNSVGEIIKDNVLKNIALSDSDSSAQPAVNTNNMLQSGASSPNFNGTPQFVGGSNPTTYAGFALASGSPGTGRASDGSDVGIRAGGSQPPPPDTTPPDTTITSAPADPSTATSASFVFNSTEAGSTFECKLDAGAYASCTSPKSYSGLSTGSHTFSVRATDPAGNTDASPATWTWTINATSDTTPPDTTIGSGPSNPTTSTSASFAFTSSEPASTFQCKLDAGAYAACTSPKSYSGLSTGPHTFSVRATDPAGNTDASPATFTWTINPPADTTPPDTTITSGPSGPTNDATPTFAFSSSEPGSTFACRVDSNAYAACTSAWTTPAMSDGGHTVSVRATDAAGNTDASPATRSFTVDTVAPQTTITSSPPAVSLSGTGDVAFTVNESGATSQCRLDGGAWAACTSPYHVSGLGIGSHTVDVRSTDAAGNVESPGASASWTVVLPVTDSAPTVTLTAPTANSTVGSTVKLTASATAPSGVSKVEFWVDSKRVASDATAPYGSKVTLPSSLRNGMHTVTARAFDTSGAAASSASLVRVSRSTGKKSRARAARVVDVGGPRARALAATAVAGPDTTQVAGQAPKSRMLRVSLTRCGDANGAVADSLRLHPDGLGRVESTRNQAGLCVLRISLA
jgi:Bacterial Ig domain/Bacterial Ig-like domain/Right handed beta helix region